MVLISYYHNKTIYITNHPKVQSLTTKRFVLILRGLQVDHGSADVGWLRWAVGYHAVSFLVLPPDCDVGQVCSWFLSSSLNQWLQRRHLVTADGRSTSTKTNNAWTLLKLFAPAMSTDSSLAISLGQVQQQWKDPEMYDPLPRNSRTETSNPTCKPLSLNCLCPAHVQKPWKR